MESGATVLVVDDDEFNLKVLSRFVGSLGCEVRCAENGLAALHEVRQNPIDLILLDIMMPQIDGYSVLTSLKSDPSTMGIPVLVISAFDDSSNVLRCIEAGADDFMTKPFNSHLLRARVQACLAKRKHQEKENQYCREVEANNLRLEQYSEERIAPIADSRRRLSLVLNTQQQLMRQILLLTENSVSEKPRLAEWICSEDEERRAPVPAEIINAAARSSLFLGELATKVDSIAKNRCSIADVLIDAIARVQPFARAREVAVAPIPAIDLEVTGDRDLLADAFAIFFQKAVECSAQGGRVDILFEVANPGLITLLHSSGGFIPREQLMAIYDLRRSERQGKRASEFGPPLARTVIELFGGQLALDSMDDGVFHMIELPIDAEPGR